MVLAGLVHPATNGTPPAPAGLVRVLASSSHFHPATSTSVGHQPRARRHHRIHVDQAMRFQAPRPAGERRDVGTSLSASSGNSPRALDGGDAACSPRRAPPHRGASTCAAVAERTPGRGAPAVRAAPCMAATITLAPRFGTGQPLGRRTARRRLARRRRPAPPRAVLHCGTAELGLDRTTPRRRCGTRSRTARARLVEGAISGGAASSASSAQCETSSWRRSAIALYCRCRRAPASAVSARGLRIVAGHHRDVDEEQIGRRIARCTGSTPPKTLSALGRLRRAPACGRLAPRLGREPRRQRAGRRPRSIGAHHAARPSC